MIRLRALDVVVDDADIRKLKHEFQTTLCVVLPGLLDISLHSLLLPMVERGPWQDHTRGTPYAWCHWH